MEDDFYDVFDLSDTFVPKENYKFSKLCENRTNEAVEEALDLCDKFSEMSKQE